MSIGVRSPHDFMKLAAITLALALALQVASDGTRQLFNSKDLDLWQHVGKGWVYVDHVRALRPK